MSKSPETGAGKVTVVILVVLAAICNPISIQCVFARGDNPTYDQRVATQPLIFRGAKQEQTIYRPAKLRYDGRPFIIHSLPSEVAFITGRLKPPTDAVELRGNCVRQWCYIRYGTIVGWLRKYRLIEPAPLAENPTVAAPLPETDDLSEKAKAVLPPAPDKTRAVDPPVVALPPEAQESRQQVTAANIPLPIRKIILPPPAKVAVQNTPQPIIPTAAEDADSYLIGSDRLVIADIPKKTYSLAGFEGKTSLSVRGDHDEAAPILGTIPAAGEVEALGICVEGWCLIRNGELRGWVERRHLADKDLTDAQTFKFEALGPEKRLSLYDYPSPDAKVIGEILAPATNITPIGQCDKEWCHISYLGSAGWVSSKYLSQR